MPKIVTLTLNPAVDIATSVDALMPSHKMRCGPVRRDPGGGGINVARTVQRLGGRAVAVYAAGGGSGGELESLLEREGVSHVPVHVAAHTRESFNVTETSSGRQFRFVLPGEPLTESERDSCVATVASHLEDGDYFVMSGSMPPGTGADFGVRALRSARKAGARTVVDTQGDFLRAALEEGIDLVKGSAREIGEYLGCTPQGFEEWRKAAADLVRAGNVQMVAVTLGENGAILAERSGAWSAEVPQVQVSTTVGAGDSFLGGLLVGLVGGASVDGALRRAAAAGTASLLTVGTGLCDPVVTAQLEEQVIVRSMDAS